MQDENEDFEIIKLHVKNLPYNVTRKDLIRVFRNYGEINSCFLKFSSTDKPYPIYAFITYETPDEALRAQNSTIIINGYRLQISPANPWHQYKTIKKERQNPFRKYISKKLVNKNDNEECNENNIIFNVLNEDCLMKILSYIDLPELIRSERVSKQWKYFVEAKYKSFVEFDTGDCEYKGRNAFFSILKRIGPNLRKLCIDQNDLQSHHKSIVKKISKYCTNLLELRVKNMIVESWHNFLKKSKNIEVLEFTNCETISDETFKFCSEHLEELIINEADGPIGLLHLNVTRLKKLSIVNTMIKESVLLKIFEKSDKLKQLRLQGVEVEDRFIKNVIKLLPNLTHLSFHSLDIDDSIYAISKLKHLKSLQLKAMCHLSDDMIQIICRECVELTSLDISVAFMSILSNKRLTNKSIQYIWSLKHLEELNINGLELTDEHFMELGRSGKGSKLRVLFCRKNDQITPLAICHIFLNCPQLEKIDLYGCSKINSTIIDQLVTIIHSKGCVPNRYFLNLSFRTENDICSCLNVTYEPIDFFDGFFDYDDDDDDDDDEDNSGGYDDYFDDFFSDSIEDDDVMPLIFILPDL